VTKRTAAGVLVLAAAAVAWQRGALDGDAETQTADLLDGLAGTAASDLSSALDAIDMDTAARNVSAFLSSVRAAEGTDRAPDPYRVVYGYGYTLRDLSDHPVITGEWGGVVLTDEQCRGAGLGPGCRSTAAGAYQITGSTWRVLRRRISLPDFGPDSQDRAAVELIRDRGALADVQAGRVAQATERVRRVWASMPGAGYAGQGSRSLDWIISRYTGAGGALA
jgi:lysozyme